MRRVLFARPSVAAGIAALLLSLTTFSRAARRDASRIPQPQQAAASAEGPGGADSDRDGVDDAVEDSLAERFAPVVYHGQYETNYPVTVDWLLKRTALHEYDAAAKERTDRVAVQTVASQAALLDRTFVRPGAQAVDSVATRSVCKRSGYFLADVPEADRLGQRDTPTSWLTYVHSYRNTAGGITLQYWRVYAYDRTRVLFSDWGHGGDWEAVAVHLDGSSRPEAVSFLGHRGIDRRPARDVAWEGTHPKVWSEEGGHASRHAPSSSSSKFTRQETWTGGAVLWSNGRHAAGGGLLNVGEKSAPRNGQLFLQYSGLWGSPHAWFLTSGYWGPAFNETGAVCDDGRAAYRLSLGCGARSDCPRIFHTAWCDGMDGRSLSLARECYAERSAP